jgi:hypothetical protein
VTNYTLIGVDPGLVHSGVVAISLDTEARTIEVRHDVIQGPDAVKIHESVDRFTAGRTKCWIEQYRDRGTAFQAHGKMREFETLIQREIGWAVLLQNMGSKKIVRKPLMVALHAYKFPTTNHQDLQAAARIAIFGALKNDELNGVITDVVMDHIDGRPWTLLN